MGVRNLRFVLTGQDKGASKALDGLGKKAGGLRSLFSGMAGPLAGAAGLGGILSFSKGSVDAFKEAEESAADLAFAFEKFPALADSNVASFQKLNEELAQKTRFDDDATASGQAVLAQFGLTGQQIEKITPLLQDYAAKTGKDLPDAARDLGKAFDGNARALKPLGINYKSTKDKAKDFANIQGLLNDKVGGFAERQGKTAAGQAEILSNKFGELKESVGEQLMPVMEGLVTFLSDTGVPALQELSDGFKNGTGPGGDLKQILQGMYDVGEDLAPAIKSVASGTGEFVGWVADNPEAVQVFASGVAAYAIAMKAAAASTALMAGIDLIKLSLGIGAVGAASGTAAPKVATLGTKAAAAAGPIGAMVAALVALQEIGVDLEVGGKGTYDKLMDGLKSKDLGKVWDAVWGDGFTKDAPAGQKATNGWKPLPGSSTPAIAPPPRTTRSGDDYRRPVVIQNVITLDGERVARNNRRVEEHRVRNGAVPGFAR